MRKLLISLTILVFGILIVSCGSEQAPANPNGKRYPFKGEILTFDKTSHKASIKHEKIDGYMDAMTMDFEIKKPEWAFEELRPGSMITGELVVDNENGSFWIEIEGIVAGTNKQEASPLREEKNAVGQKLIDFSLKNQDGKTIGPNDFLGKTFAVTFIYSQCPLPKFCILISKNFSDAANSIAADAESKARLKLLSISFDPSRDTPEKLREYGLGYLGKDSPDKNFDVWQLAVGSDKEIRKVADFAGLRYEVDAANKTQFNHSLRTLIVGPDGVVKKVLSGNDWTPEDLIREMTTVSKAASDQQKEPKQ